MLDQAPEGVSRLFCGENFYRATIFKLAFVMLLSFGIGEDAFPKAFNWLGAVSQPGFILVESQLCWTAVFEGESGKPRRYRTLDGIGSHDTGLRIPYFFGGVQCE